LGPTARLFTAQNIPYVPSQWFLNTKEELYLNYLSKYAAEYVPGVALVSRPAGANSGAGQPAAEDGGATQPQPGDIICVKHRWVYSHGAIVVAWPKVIHCFPPCVMESHAHYNPAFASREVKFFNPWGLAADQRGSAQISGQGVRP